MKRHHLILSRRTDEKIIVDFTALLPPTQIIDERDASIIIGVRGIRQNQIKLDFFAPEIVKIWRQEILRRNT